MGGSLTARERELLEVLTQRVRVLSIDQVQGAWWGSGEGAKRGLRRRLGFLEEQGYLQVYSLMAHPAPDLDRGPLASWQPGSPVPDLGQLARELRFRWPASPRATRVVVATHRAAARFGGHGGRRPRPTESSHDLGLSKLYLRLRQEDRSRARAWVSEAELASTGWGGHGGVLPDALIADESMPTVIEFCGVYPCEKLERFHEVCSSGGLKYELW